MASALAGPRRRRGGNHAAALGGVALQGRLQRATKGGGLASGRRVGASVMQNVAGQALHCAGDGSAQRRRGKKQRKELEVEERIILQFLKIPGTSL